MYAMRFPPVENTMPIMLGVSWAVFSGANLLVENADGSISITPVTTTGDQFIPGKPLATINPTPEMNPGYIRDTTFVYIKQKITPYNQSLTLMTDWAPGTGN
jgi:hypothetical protein